MTISPFMLSRARGQISPNETIHHAVIGTGGQGGGHVRSFQETSGCEAVAVCDVDPENLAKAAKNASRHVKTYTDLCKLANIGYRTGIADLRYDPKKVEITNSAEANAFVRRSYRKAYELPYQG